MSAIVEELKSQRRAELSAEIEERVGREVRELVAQKAASAEQRVTDIRSNLEAAERELADINAAVAELDAVQG